jgi:predicted NBD/HSP70 family sugar kinase
MDELVAKLRKSPVGTQPLARVLRAIARADASGKPMTRQELAGMLDLSPATISKAVAELREPSIELVEERKFRDDEGRAQKPLVLAKADYGTIGISVADSAGQASDVSGALANLRGDILSAATRDIRSKAPGVAIKELLSLATELAERGRLAGRQILGVGIQVGGHVKDGVVIRSVNNAWEGVNLRQQVEEHLGLPTFVENDVTGLTIGSHLHSLLGRQWSSRALVAVFEEGVGAGLVINGSVFRGAHGLASELGHVTVDYSKQGRICRCGAKGCLEAYATPSAVSQAIAGGMTHTAAYASAGQALGRALADLAHITDIGRIDLLLPETYHADTNPPAGAFHTACDSEISTIFSANARPEAETSFYTAATLAEQRTDASAAIVLQGLIDRISGRP